MGGGRQFLGSGRKLTKLVIGGRLGLDIGPHGWLCFQPELSQPFSRRKFLIMVHAHKPPGKAEG